MIKLTGELHETDSNAGDAVRLGFHEIVPGLSSASEEDHGPQDTAPPIPEFNLERQMMALHRRATAAKRKGPGQRKQAEVKPAPVVQDARLERRNTAWATSSVPRYNPVIADIVARDLARLCGGANIVNHTERL